MPRLSVLIATRDDAERLPRLLQRVGGIADEVVVVDAGSTDGTVEVARAAGARVVDVQPPPGPSGLTHGLSAATGDYVLQLEGVDLPDAELVAAIRAELDRPGGAPHAGYRISVRPIAFGRPLRFGAYFRERRRRPVRLFRREGARHDQRSTGADPLVAGSTSDLPGTCHRLPFRDEADARVRLARDAEHLARERFRAGGRFRPWDLLRFPLGFLRRYLLQLAVLDGAAGLRLALLQARGDLDAALWLRRLEREIGGARSRARWAFELRERLRRLFVAALCLAWPPPRRALPALVDVRKILVVRPDERVGNQLLTTPLLRALDHGIPQAEIHLLAPARHAAVVSRRRVERLIPWEKRLFFRRPWRFVAQLLALRREGYDLVFEAAHWSGFSLTASLLARVAASRGAVVGHARGESPRFLSHPVAHDPANENDVRAKLELLRPLNLLPRGLAPETDLGDLATADRLLAASGVARPYAVLNPGARLADRRWPPASHAAVALGLRERGLAVLVVWGPGEEALAASIAAAGGAALAPPTGLAELASLLRGARLCVSNNTGPMHLAVACGTPTVGVFLNREARRWGHEVPSFAAAEPAGDGDHAAVLRACDDLLRDAAAAVPAQG